jgi:hypothetical protein
MIMVNFQSKATAWTNASGEVVPVKYITKSDKLKETLGSQLHKKALTVEKALAELHKLMADACDQVSLMVRQEYELKNGKSKPSTKGNLVWYNFDGSLKVEAKINDFVKWDDALMTEAKQLINEYLDSQLGEDHVLIKDLANEAFANSKGQIDSRKVFALLKYEGKIKSKRYTKACELMRQAQRVDRSKLYMMMSERLDDGSYRAINLNFSSI